MWLCSLSRQFSSLQIFFLAVCQAGFAVAPFPFPFSFPFPFPIPIPFPFPFPFPIPIPIPFPIPFPFPFSSLLSSCTALTIPTSITLQRFVMSRSFHRDIQMTVATPAGTASLLCLSST
ncbi:hypothetical protein F4780DRAFT_719199 [Xylariomycetidae sp. FL0641]|nr:hypothetical protein F4780DRAFT_719199 [Xylariomycetidae sp. FL0641]